MKASDLLLKYLEQLGVKYIFGIPGGALEPFYAAINRSQKIEAVLTRHEQGAAFMADGYARVNRQIGVCCATTGPGSTNLITGVASSYADSIPVMVITAQVPTRVFGKGALQESTYDGVNIVDIFKYFTKFSVMVINPDKMGEMVRQALRVALSGKRGPVHLNIPADVMNGEVSDGPIPIDTFMTPPMYFERENIKKAAALLLHAKKPAMFVGNGSLLSCSVEELVILADMLSIPVATTPKAKGAIPENHPLSLGVFGLAGSNQAEIYLLNQKMDSEYKKIDVLLTVGTSLNEWGTNAWDKRLIPEDALIQVDIDPYKIGKNYPCKVGLIGDARTILCELTFELKRQMHNLPPSRQKEIEKRSQLMADKMGCFKEIIAKYMEEEKMTSDDIPLKPQRLMKDLQDSLPDNTIFFIDIGSNLLWATHYLDINRPYTFFAGLGFASMGFGTAAAVGGKFARPSTPVMAIVGDGGFLMNGMEVSTAVNCNKQVIWLVENNSELGMVSHSRRLMSIPYNIGAEFEHIDFVKIAEGLGANGIRITKPGEINRKMMDDIIASGKSTVIDVVIDKEEVPPLGSRIKAITEVYF